MLRFDPTKFKAPYYSLPEIRQKADEFRESYWPSEELPVNISDIIEFELEIEIRPVQRLREFTDIDALLLGDLKGIIVDRDDFMNDRMEYRMRYSMAHEIGHFILHPKIYNNLPYKNVNEWIELIQQLPEKEYKYIEYHAYEFAGRLLVSRGNLEMDFQEAIKYAESMGFTDWNAIDQEQNEVAKDYIATAICKKYGVSDQVIIRRLDKEGLWPPTL